MIWLRKGIVHLLAVLLLAALLGMAVITGLNRDFANPTKLEAWLAASHIYDNIIPSVLDKAQTSSSQDGSGGSVSFTDPSVRQAANQVFPPTLLQQGVNAFLEGNYAWLEGKTRTPEFTINLTAPKQALANTIGQLVQSHLAGLPVCTAVQLSQLQLPVNPLSINCRPAVLDPKTEGDQVAQAINTGDFLNKPIITAASLGQNKNGQTQPYYQKLSRLPQLYRLGQHLPLILAGVALLVILGIIFIAPTRRKGLRRIGVTLLLAGAILIAVKFVSDVLVKQFEGKVLKQTFSGQLQSPYHDLLHSIESSLVQTDLYFGIAFLVMGLVIIVYLLVTHNRSARRPKVSQAPVPTSPSPGSEGKPLANADDIQLAPRRPQPTADITGPQPKPKPTAPPMGTPTRKPPRPPRLIQ